MQESRKRFRDLRSHVEPLETRQLLSATLTAAAHHSTHAQQAHVIHLHQHHHKNSALANTNVSLNLDATPAATTAQVAYSPAQIRQAYDLTGNYVNNSTGQTITGDGSGQTIAIVDAYYDRNLLSDLQTFDSQWGLSNTDATGKSVLTQAAYTTTSNAGWGLETSLDAEWAHAIAPKAHLLVVEARSSSTADLLTAVDYARNHGASVVSMSWGSNEFNGETSYDSHFNHSGVSYIASAGDAAGVAEWPAEATDVLSVGGTNLQLDASGNRAGETVWGTSTVGASGTGGGVSLYEPKPAYQGNVTLSSTHRTNPDVSYDADPATGFYVYDSNYNGQAGWFDVGGTSAGAPQWAGLVAIADQLRSSVHEVPLDTLTSDPSNLLDKVYSASSTTSTGGNGSAAFFDVTAGTAGSNAGRPGYDLATGNGSPFADQLIVGLV